MLSMRATRIACALPCLLAAAALASGCGGDSDSTSATTVAPVEAAPSRPAPPQSEFPTSARRTLRQVLKAAADGPAEVIVSPAAMVFYKGENRYSFGVFERDETPVSDAEVAIYYAKVPTPRPGAKSKSGNKGPAAKAQKKALDEPAVGPFPAAVETLATKPAFRAETPAGSRASNVVYSAKIDFPSNGEWRLAAVVKQGDEVRATPLPSAVVGEFTHIPRPGQPAPKIHTPTAADVDGDLARLTTRQPPDTQNEVDYADALGKEPIVLLFATPKFCQSRVCGPVVDVAEQVQRESGEKAAFIHMEIYNDNDPAEGVRPQARAFHLPSEPWLFTINRHGVVSSVVEGAFGLERMREAVDKVVSE